jgi:hypothetical protein
MSQALSTLSSFASMTESMLQAASEQDWDLLTQLGRARSDLVSTMPENISRHLLPSEQAAAMEVIENCRRLDARTLAMLGERQDELRILLREPALG